MARETRISSADWWAATRDDRGRLIAWLFAQYRGEVTAAGRITALRDRFARPGTRAHRVLSTIAAQEARHAEWVGALLQARGSAPVVRGAAEDRYWRRTLPGITDLATGCAVGAHAEAMRLERIAVIAADANAPADIREVFARILPEEEFHERAFRGLATADSLAATRDAHALGRAALGLAP
jgi:hypothetical protein